MITTINQVLTEAAVRLTILPEVCAERPPGFEFVDTLLAWMKWGGIILAAFALVMAAVRLMWNNSRGSQTEGLDTIGKILIAVVIIGSVSTIIGFVADGSGC